MKKFVKILALLLCLTTVLGAVACDSTETDGTSDAQPEGTSQASPNDSDPSGSESGAEETEPEYVPDIDQKNYNATLYLQCFGEVNLKYLWTDKSNQSVVSEAIYERQAKIKDHIGVEIVGTVASGNHLTYHEGFTTSQKNKDGSVDLFITSPYTSIPMLITEGYARDFESLPGIDLDADYWNIDFMDTLALEGKYYLGYSDFNVAKAYVISYNKDMLERYTDALDETIYETVKGYRWTIDKMISLANLVYIDATGDGKTKDDTFGITGQQWVPYLVFMQSSNIPLVEQNEAGAYEVSVMNDLYKIKTTTLAEKLGDLAKSESAWFRYREEDTPMVGLETGRTLMSLVATTALENYMDYNISFGVLPYPMYDEAQKDVGYRSLNWDGYTMIPAYLGNEKMVGETLELLSYYAQPVRVAVFEKMLGKQISETPNDAAMLDIVWDNICSDFGMTYSHLDGSLDNNMYMLAQVTNPNGTLQIASYVSGYTKAANGALRKFMKEVEKKRS